MTMRNDLHLNEEEILIAVVEEGDLTAQARDHISRCALCGDRKQRIEQSLARMGRLVDRFAPVPREKVVLAGPEVGSPRRFRWLSGRGWIPAAGVMAVSVVLMAFSMLFSTRQNEVRLRKEMLEDERLITEVGRLEENVLPAFYYEISEAVDQDSDDEVMESLTRSTELHACLDGIQSNR